MDHAKELYGFIERHKRVPTYRELVDVWSYKTKSAVDYRIKKLVAAGLIGKVGGRLMPLNADLVTRPNSIVDRNRKSALSRQQQ